MEEVWVFFFGTLCLIPGFHLFVYSVHSTCIRWAFSMCQLLFKAHVITTVKKRDKYSCPCRNYILSYCGVYRTFNLWFGVIITKHCVIMIWEKVRFLICVLYPLTWYEKNPKSWKKKFPLEWTTFIWVWVEILKTCSVARCFHQKVCKSSSFVNPGKPNSRHGLKFFLLFFFYTFKIALSLFALCSWWQSLKKV